MGVLGRCSTAGSPSFEAGVIPDMVDPPSEPSWGRWWALCSEGNICRILFYCLRVLWPCPRQHNPWASMVKAHVGVSRWEKHSDKAPLGCSITCAPVPHGGPLVTLRVSLQSCLEQLSSITAP